MVSIWIILLMDFCAGVNFGTSISNLSTQIIEFMSQSISNKFDPKDPMITGLLSVSVLIGSMVGSMSIAFVMQRFGSKKISIVASFAGAVLNGLTMIPVHWGYLFAIRILVGIPTAALTTTVPSWLSELATIQQRGLLTVFFQLFICLGIIASSVILLIIGKQANLWWISFLFTMIICILCGVVCFFVPDSIQQNDIDSKEEIKKQEEVSWKELFTASHFRKCLVVAFLIGVCAQGTGINSVIVYATKSFTSVFENLGETLSAAVGSLLISGVNFISTLVALPFINKLGRKFLWFSGCSICLIGQIMFIIYYTLPESKDKPRPMALLISASIIFLFGFEIGPGPCFFVLVGEMFPQCARSKLSSLAFTMNWICNIIVVLIFPFFEKFVWAAYIVYMVLMTVPLVILWFCIPETKGKSMKEIETIMIGDYKQISNNEGLDKELLEEQEDLQMI